MTPRRNVLNTLLKVTEEGAFANLAAKEGLSDVQPSAVGRSTALFYTAIEHMAYCDYIIAHYAKGRLQPAVKGVLRLAAAELMFMDTPSHAVVNESVKLIAEIGKAPLKGYVNGVLRSIVRDIESGKLPALPEDACERLNIETGYPLFFIRQYADAHGLRFTEDMLKAVPVGMTLRPVYPHGINELTNYLDEEGVAWQSTVLHDAVNVIGMGDISSDDGFTNGLYTVQSIGAMLACRCLAPVPGMQVLDCCAAPGGKTAYLFDLMERRGSVTAWDIHPHRVGLITAAMQRLGIACEAEGRSTGLDGIVHADVKDASKHDSMLDNSFDALLCDVPCSGLGGGSKPDARYRRTEADVKALSELQYAILDNCSGYLKPGGALVYSTCTLCRSENEDIVNRFLREHKEYELQSLAPFLPEVLKERGADGMLTLYPHIDGIEGFYMARLKKSC